MSVARLLDRFFKIGQRSILQRNSVLYRIAIFSGVVSPPLINDCTPSMQFMYQHIYYPLALEPCYHNAPWSLVDETAELGDESLPWDGVLWAVPKKRTSHSKKRMRMTHKYLKPKHHYTVCPNCNNLKLLHVLCGHCLKETLRQTAAMRRSQMQQKLQVRDNETRREELTSTR